MTSVTELNITRAISVSIGRVIKQLAHNFLSSKGRLWSNIGADLDIGHICLVYSEIQVVGNCDWNSGRSQSFTPTFYIGIISKILFYGKRLN